ncbi:hypothetical protein B0H17DRAFT_1204920 [Mycena rosella]|uniref:Uncharacterized protein n=1 Tax=Mycena rosella TaxID=1033263 RepID=A0AAD7CH29_MYCRO|nr:hypothetical protein B0H17DRAFT_1215612 [Mycena rosella]KAJ7683786.1 hypothetical protein B0H17DRAFT_1204920 [Mycena rosella]
MSLPRRSWSLRASVRTPGLHCTPHLHPRVVRKPTTSDSSPAVAKHKEEMAAREKRRGAAGQDMIGRDPRFARSSPVPSRPPGVNDMRIRLASFPPCRCTTPVTRLGFELRREDVLAPVQMTLPSPVARTNLSTESQFPSATSSPPPSAPPSSRGGFIGIPHDDGPPSDAHRQGSSRQHACPALFAVAYKHTTGALPAVNLTRMAPSRKPPSCPELRSPSTMFSSPFATSSFPPPPVRSPSRRLDLRGGRVSSVTDDRGTRTSPKDRIAGLPVLEADPRGRQYQLFLSDPLPGI